METKTDTQPSNALWSGTLSFGLVSVPVAMISATHSRRSDFHLLHKTDHSRLRRRMFCPKQETFVLPEHIVRGYEVSPDKYVVIQDSDIESIAPDRSRSIEVEMFVPVKDIDPLYYRRPYYLVPAGAEKAYRLLVETLKQAGKAGIAQFVMHDRQYLCAVLSIDDALCLVTLYFQPEVLGTEELAGHGKANASQVRAIRQSIDKLKGDFKPERLRDIYQERVQRLIHNKQKHHETVEVPAAQREHEESEAETAEGVDLIEALEASLAKARRRKVA